jgi:hypothetical protein
MLSASGEIIMEQSRSRIDKRRRTLAEKRREICPPTASPQVVAPVTIGDLEQIVNSARLSGDVFQLLATQNELLLNLIRRLSAAVVLWESQQHVLSRTEQVTVDTTATLLYLNSFPYPVTLVVFNLDPAQTVYVGGKTMTVNDSLPVFPEASDRYTIQEGSEVYARVAAGSIDLRFYTTMRRL